MTGLMKSRAGVRSVIVSIVPAGAVWYTATVASSTPDWLISVATASERTGGCGLVRNR